MEQGFQIISVAEQIINVRTFIIQLKLKLFVIYIYIYIHTFLANNYQKMKHYLALIHCANLMTLCASFPFPTGLNAIYSIYLIKYPIRALIPSRCHSCNWMKECVLWNAGRDEGYRGATQGVGERKENIPKQIEELLKDWKVQVNMH